MATKLSKPVTREASMKDLNGASGDVLVTLVPYGVTLRGKGTRRELTLTWEQLQRAAMAAPSPAMPAKFISNPLGWLIETQQDDKPADPPPCSGGDVPTPEPATSDPVAAV